MRTYSTLGETADRTVYADILSDYTKTHKNVVINDTTTTPAAGYKMALSIASTYRGANVPDVIYYSSIKDMSQLSDFFMTVDEIRADYPQFAASLSEAAIDSAAADDGNRYCIPVRGDWRGVIINAALFRRSGLPIPETWEDIVRAARHFQKGEVSLFANALDESAPLLEYLVRGLGGLSSVQSAMDGHPDECWSQAMDAIAQLDELNAFPSMPPEAFDYLISSSDLQHTAAEKLPSAVERYNSGKAAILLMDHTTCGAINTDLDSEYIALPPFGSISSPEVTTTANSYPNNGMSGPVYPRNTANTLPPTQPSEQSPQSGGGAPLSGAGESTPPPSQTSATRPAAVSSSDRSQKNVSENGLYVDFAEGFYITKKAYYDSDKREDVLAFVESFLTEDNITRLCGDNCRVPALASLSRDAEDRLTDKSFIYHGVIQSVQSADSFLLTTQTQENQFFWNHTAMAVEYMSKGVLTKQQTLRLIADTQATAADMVQKSS